MYFPASVMPSNRFCFSFDSFSKAMNSLRNSFVPISSATMKHSLNGMPMMKATGRNIYEQIIYNVESKSHFKILLKILPFFVKAVENKKGHSSFLWNWTSNVMPGYPTIPPSHLKAALIKSKMARNPIKLAAMFATSPIDADAPLEAASRIFCSPLITNRIYSIQTNSCSL